MIKTEELEEAIAECWGQRNPNANTCLKLASYYTILDHLGDEKTEDTTPKYSFAAPPLNIKYSDSEYSQMVKDKGIEVVFPIMDDLMNTLSVVNPKLYRSVLRRIDEV